VDRGSQGSPSHAKMQTSTNESHVSADGETLVDVRLGRDGKMAYGDLEWGDTPTRDIEGGRMSPADLEQGRLYTYMAAYPPWATGETYRVLRFVKDVPSYQKKVLVEAMTGRDKGLWFVCTVSNFCTRYRPRHDAGQGDSPTLMQEPGEPGAGEKVVDAREKPRSAEGSPVTA